MDQTLNSRLLLIALCSLSECIQHRYHYINIGMNWTEAQKYCRENYTDLATVNNMNDMNKLNKTVNNNVNVWIGLKNTRVNKWKWSLGNPLNYQNWTNGQINDQNNCTFMKNGTWQSENCNANLSFICYNENSKKYTLVKTSKTWREAQSFCRRNHTDLTSVRNQTENKHIENIINNTETSVWIGLFRDSWEWSDHSDSTFRNWESGEPKGGSDPLCTEVRMAQQGQWNDAGCCWASAFVCHEDKLILIKQNLNWMEALIYCRQNHVDLVSVDSEEIQHWVTDVVKNASTTEVWLGLRHSCTLDTWYWVNGEIVCYENWAEGNETAVQDCETVKRSGAVQSGGDHRWINLLETEKRNFICSRYD